MIMAAKIRWSVYFDKEISLNGMRITVVEVDKLNVLLSSPPWLLLAYIASGKGVKTKN